MTTKTKTRGARTQVIKRTVYTARHLKRYYPDAFARAHERHCENMREDTYRMDEIMDSLKGLFDAAGVKMSDWEIGAYSYSHLRADFTQEEAGELDGARAFAWLENNLFGPLRAPWGLPKLKKGAALPEGFTRGWIAPSKEYPHGCVTADDKNPVTRWTRPGAMRECPFTGVCYDMDFVDALVKAIKGGDTLRDAFASLADEARRLIEAEDEYEQEEASFLDAADANGWEYTREGGMVR